MADLFHGTNYGDKEKYEDFPDKFVSLMILNFVKYMEDRNIDVEAGLNLVAIGISNAVCDDKFVNSKIYNGLKECNTNKQIDEMRLAGIKLEIIDRIEESITARIKKACGSSSQLEMLKRETKEEFLEILLNHFGKTTIEE